MNVRLSIAVMAMPSRAEQAERLAEQVGATIVWDRGRGQSDTAYRALGAHDRGATHHIILEDDALPVPDFRRHAAEALAVSGERPLVSFYLGMGVPVLAQPFIEAAIPYADRAGAAWFGNAPVAGVALAYPVRDLTPLRRWWRDPATPKLPYDERVSLWYRQRQRPVLATWPSLVDHADGPSTIHPPIEDQLPRVAWRVGVPASWRTTVMHMHGMDKVVDLIPYLNIAS